MLTSISILLINVFHDAKLLVKLFKPLTGYKKMHFRASNEVIFRCKIALRSKNGAPHITFTVICY